MFDNNQVVDTKDLAKAIQALSALSVNEGQLKQVEVLVANGEVNYVAPGMITRIINTTFYNPEREASWVYYINGDHFKLDIPVKELAKQIKLEE